MFVPWALGPSKRYSARRSAEWLADCSQCLYFCGLLFRISVHYCSQIDKQCWVNRASLSPVNHHSPIVPSISQVKVKQTSSESTNHLPTIGAFRGQMLVVHEPFPVPPQASLCTRIIVHYSTSSLIIIIHDSWPSLFIMTSWLVTIVNNNKWLNNHYCTITIVSSSIHSILSEPS